jgi:hypothetical protein
MPENCSISFLTSQSLLEKNEKAIKPYWEFVFDIMAPKSKVDQNMFMGWLQGALQQMAIDKEAAKQRRQQKQLANGGAPAQIAASAQQTTSSGLSSAVAGDIPPF